MAGFTPLMLAAEGRHSSVVSSIIPNGADISIAGCVSFTALVFAAHNGALDVTWMLVEAGSDVEARKYDKGCTVLHLAEAKGYLEVMKVLIEARANPNNLGIDGVTPLFSAALNGHVEAVRELLRAKADPRLARTQLFGATTPTAEKGHSGVGGELTRQGVSEGGGFPSGGMQALQMAAKADEVDTMAVLTDAGVVDTGAALILAADLVKDTSVKFLLQQCGGDDAEERLPQLEAIRRLLLQVGGVHAMSWAAAQR
eukprot:g15696.t1